MALIATAKGGSDFQPCPAGLHDAICAFVEDLGYEYSEQFKKETRKIIICWEINVPMSDGRPYMLSQRYTLSLSDKANLRRVLEGWRGRPFTAAELEGFDVEKVRGVQCQIQVMHNSKNGKTYANIAAVLPASKNGIKLTVVNTELPEWIEKVKEENAAAHAKLEAAPIVITDSVGTAGAPKIPQHGADHSEPPF